MFHSKFLISCKFCQEAFGKTCHRFNISKRTLSSQGNSIEKDFLESYIIDFLKISQQTINSFYKEEITRMPVQKNIQVKSYIKSHKNRTQVINHKVIDCKKINYKLGGKQRMLYQKL